MLRSLRSVDEVIIFDQPTPARLIEELSPDVLVNPRCGCLSGQGHPQTIFLFKDDQGRRRCKLVRRADEVRMHKAGDRYRKWRKALNRLRAIEKRQRQILLAEIKKKAIFYE